jgi:membrane-associated phospholipid phosphatase
MLLRKIIRNTIPVDVITALYLIITGVYVIFGFFKIEYALFHLLFRAGILALIFLFIIADQQLNKPFFRFLRNFYPLGLFAFFYAETDSLNNLIFSHNLDQYIVNLEETLFGGQPSIWFYQYFPWNWFNELMNAAYFSFYLLIFILCFWIYRNNESEGKFSIFIICSSFYIYYILFILFPVAGPQFHFDPPYNKIPDAYIFRDIMKFIDSVGERPTAAFPSSHVGIVCILWYLAFKYAKPLLKWYIPIGIALFFSTVYIKAHYVIDVIAGILSAPTIYWMSRGLFVDFESSLSNSKTIFGFIRKVLERFTQRIPLINHLEQKKK